MSASNWEKQRNEWRNDKNKPKQTHSTMKNFIDSIKGAFGVILAIYVIVRVLGYFTDSKPEETKLECRLDPQCYAILFDQLLVKIENDLSDGVLDNTWYFGSDEWQEIRSSYDKIIDIPKQMAIRKVLYDRLYQLDNRTRSIVEEEISFYAYIQ